MRELVEREIDAQGVVWTRGGTEGRLGGGGADGRSGAGIDGAMRRTRLVGGDAAAATGIDRSTAGIAQDGGGEHSPLGRGGGAASPGLACGAGEAGDPIPARGSDGAGEPVPARGSDGAGNPIPAREANGARDPVRVREAGGAEGPVPTREAGGAGYERQPHRNDGIASHGAASRIAADRRGASGSQVRASGDGARGHGASRGPAHRLGADGGGTEPPSARRRGRSVTVNLGESPLGWLRSRGLVDARQFEAGERLRADYETAAIAPAVTMRWRARVDGGAGEALDPTLAQIAAKRRFDTAMAAVGPGLKDVLWRVVCAGEALPAAERALGWPTRSAKLVLGLALDRLAGFYGLG